MMPDECVGRSAARTHDGIRIRWLSLCSPAGDGRRTRADGMGDAACEEDGGGGKANDGGLVVGDTLDDACKRRPECGNDLPHSDAP